MEVILLQDVRNVGKKFQEADVANGYGTNYLIPEGLAVVANEPNQKRFAKKKAEAAAERKAEREKLAQALSDVDGAEITITTDKAGDQGQLFAGIYPKDIAEAVNDEFGVEVGAADIERDQPISKVGEYEVTATILEEEATFTVVVEAAETGAADPAEEDEDEMGEESDDEGEAEGGEEEGDDEAEEQEK